jgi:hypothetical protein
VAVIVVDERPMVRTILEGQFATQFEKRGTQAVRTHELMSLEEMKADKEAAVKRMRESGVDMVLVVRETDSVTYARLVRETPAMYLPTVTGFETYGWYDYFSVGFMSMGVVRGSMDRHIFLDSSLFDLSAGKRVWSGLSRTVVKEDVDRLELVRPLVKTVLDGMHKDGLVNET